MKKLNDKEKKYIYITAIAIAIAIMLFITFVVAKPLIKYADDPKAFKVWLESFGPWSKIIFILITALQVVIAFIPGEPFEIAAGYCFGWFMGMIYSLIGITIGSIVIFLLVKKYSESFISIFFKQEDIDKLSFLKDADKMRFLVFILNLIPGTPKDVLSYFIGLTKLPLSNWIFIVFFARIPSVVTSTLAGEGLYDQSYGRTILIFAITAVISLIGIWIYNRIIKKNSKN